MEDPIDAHYDLDAVEIKQQTDKEYSMWGLNGYQTLQSYAKRNLPDSKDSILPERDILSCPLDPRPDPSR